MAIQESITTITEVAGADLRTHQFKFVTYDSSGRVVLAGDDATAIGVLQNDPNVGEAATVAISGIAKVVCGGAVTRGGTVSVGANGVAKNTGAGSAIVGFARETGASGRIISILFQPRS